MTSRGSRRLLLSGNELKERGRREAPLLFLHTLDCITDVLPWSENLPALELGSRQKVPN